MRIDLDRGQAQHLARFIVENSDRMDGVHLSVARGPAFESVRAEAHKQGRITANTVLFSTNKRGAAEV